MQANQLLLFWYAHRIGQNLKLEKLFRIFLPIQID